MQKKRFVLIALLTVSLTSHAHAAFASGVQGEQGTKSKTKRMFDGVASFYADKFHGRKTASGERFNRNAMTCAHRFLPFGTKLVVRNSVNGKSCVVTVNDRGPFCKHRVLDLSPAAARVIGMSGVSHVICYASTAGTEKFVSPIARKQVKEPGANLPEDDVCIKVTD